MVRIQKIIFLLLIPFGLTGCPLDSEIYLYNNSNESLELTLIDRSFILPAAGTVTIGGDFGELRRGGDPMKGSWPILVVGAGSKNYSYDPLLASNT